MNHQTSDLAGFLLARIAEDEEDARAASIFTKERWHAMRGTGNVQNDILEVVAIGPYGRSLAPRHDHIARWDPARVLAECEAKRRIVAESRSALERRETTMTPTLFGRDQALDAVLELLALPYADHPDYREEWRL